MGRVGWESAITQNLESQIHLLPRGICNTQYTVPRIRDLLLSRDISDHWVHRTQDPSLPQGVSEHSVLSVRITRYLLDPDATEESNRETEVSRLWLQLETAYRWRLPGLLEKIPMQRIDSVQAQRWVPWSCDGLTSDDARVSGTNCSKDGRPHWTVGACSGDGWCHQLRDLLRVAPSTHFNLGNNCLNHRLHSDKGLQQWHHSKSMEKRNEQAH